MLLSSTQQRLRSEIWRCSPSSVAHSEPLVRQLQGMSSRGNLWDFGETFSHISRILKLALKCPYFHKKSCTEYDWERKCTPNGRHRRSQTKSSFGDDSRQFCVDPNGNRIFGDSSNQDSEIQCRCSRKVWELNQQNRPEQDVMLHCQGTYIPIFVNVKNSFIWSS